MALKNVAVAQFSHSISNPLVVATVVHSGTPSTTCKAGGKGICKDGHTMSVSAIMVPSVGATIPDPGPYTATFSKTAAKVKADNTLVLRVDDETDTINANPKIPGSPPVVYPVSFKLKISDAGQAKVKAQ